MTELQLTFAAFLALPLILAAASATLIWKSVARPWVYLLAAAFTLYLLFAFVFTVWPTYGGIGISRGKPGQELSSSVLYRAAIAAVLFYFQKQLVIFMMAALPTLIALVRAFRRRPDPSRG